MQEFITAFPEQWRQVIGMLMSPIAWIPRTHDILMGFFFESPSAWVAGGAHSSSCAVAEDTAAVTVLNATPAPSVSAAASDRARACLPSEGACS